MKGSTALSSENCLLPIALKLKKNLKKHWKCNYRCHKVRGGSQAFTQKNDQTRFRDLEKTHPIGMK